jgi:cell wall-associated NlpC family hydrolase
MTLNVRVVAAARGWIGTSFHHQGRIRKNASHKGGVDCLGLLVGVAAEIGITLPDGRLAASLDKTDYPHYPDTERLRRRLSAIMENIPTAGIQAGDILVLSVDGSPQHLAIVSDYREGLGIIHAYAPARKVVEQALDDFWTSRIVAAYRLPNPISS